MLEYLIMSGEFEEKIETRTKSKGKPSTKTITLRQAIANRKNFLWKQWADINNFLDFSKKPELKVALSNIQNQIEKLAKDEENLQLEFSS